MIRADAPTHDRPGDIATHGYGDGFYGSGVYGSLQPPVVPIRLVLSVDKVQVVTETLEVSLSTSVQPARLSVWAAVVGLALGAGATPNEVRAVVGGLVLATDEAL